MTPKSTRLAAGILFFCALVPAPAVAVSVTSTVVNGLQVLRYVWTDSAGRYRSVSLKREGLGNPGHGGYAVQMTYRAVVGGVLQTITVDPSDANDGFGYFVSHERERRFTDNTSATIAGKIFHVDDSPLGRGFAVTTTSFATTADRKQIRFGLNYPRYGTVAANGIDPNTGEDQPPLGTAKALFAKYNLPVKLTWTFQDGTDFPRISVAVSLASLPGADRVSFDVRGPYGKMNFDRADNPIQQVRWGDHYQFATTKFPLTRNSTWTWTTLNGGARYSSLIAGGYEMGLLEPVPFASTRTNDGYSDGRSHSSAAYFGGNGCPFQAQLIPCDYEWSYQSAQYELPYNDRNGTTISEKMAWGSTPYYGTSLDSTYDGTRSVPFDGFPASKVIAYDVCVVLGRTVTGGLTRTIALAGNGYRCATLP